MIRFADEQMRPDVRGLWQACFGDPNEYVDAFLDHYDLCRHMLVFMDGDHPASMMSLLPMTLVTKTGRSVVGRYIYGVATDPRYRGRGLSTKLLAYAHRILKNRGIALSVLAPAGQELFAFYGQRGFESAFYMGVGVVDGAWIKPPEGSFLVKQAEPKQFYHVREKAFGGRTMFVRWDGDALAYRLWETAMLGGETLLLTASEGQAVAVCFHQGEQLLVKELALDGLSLEKALGILGAKYRPQEFSLRLPMDQGEGLPLRRTPWGMAHWYDAALRMQVLSTMQNDEEPYMNLILD